MDGRMRKPERTYFQEHNLRDLNQTKKIFTFESEKQQALH